MTGSQVGSSGALYQSRRVPPDASASTRPTPVRSTTRPLVIACASFLLDSRSNLPRPNEDCREIERDYQIIAADANTLQRNAALFSAADRGCEALAQKLLDAGASLLARDRRGAMPLTHAAREGHVRLVELFLARGAPIDARNVDGGTALFAAAEHQKPSTVALAAEKRRRSEPCRAAPA